MPYVKRELSEIVSEAKWPLAGHDEFVADDDADLIAFRAPPTDDEQAQIDLDNSKVLRVIGQVLFDHENRLRALEGQGTITGQQFRTALINRWKAL